MATLTSPRRSTFSSSPAGRLSSNPASPWRHVDLALVAVVVAITAIGVLMVYSSTRGPGGASGPFDTTFVKRQALFAVLGIGLMGLTMAFDYRRYRDLAPIAYLGTCGLLALVVSPLGSRLDSSTHPVRGGGAPPQLTLRLA